MCFSLAVESKYIVLNILLISFVVSPALTRILVLMGGLGYAVYNDEEALSIVWSGIAKLAWYVLKLSAQFEVLMNKFMRMLDLLSYHRDSFLDRKFSRDLPNNFDPITYDIVSVDDMLKANSLAEYRSMVETESICNPEFKQDYIAFVRQMGRVCTFQMDDVVDEQTVLSRLCSSSPTKWIECELMYYVDEEDAPMIRHSINIHDAKRYVALSGNNLFTPQFFRWYGIDAGIVKPIDWKRVSKCSAVVVDGDINSHEYIYDVTKGTKESCILE